MKTLYRASRVVTLSYPAVGEWVLVDGRHVERVGVGEAPEADRVVDLPGTTVLPGFVDTHVHLTGTGVHHQAPELGSAVSAAELLTVVREIAAVRQGPVYLHGWDESGWRDRTLPTLGELDRVTERPLGLARVDGHLVLVNSAGLEASEAAGQTGVETNDAGAPTGRLTGNAGQAAKRWFSTNLSDHDVEELQLAAASLAVAHGVTTIHEMSMPADRGMRDLEILLAHRSRLPLDVVSYVATTDISTVMDLGLPRIGGDLPVDGSIGARTASVSGGFVDRGPNPGGYFGDDELAQYFHDGHLAGLQVGVHAIGDAAVEQVVRTWERVYQSLDSRQRRHFRARRHRIEHFEMASLDVIERAAMLGLAISVQPTFDARWGFPGGLYEQGLGGAPPDEPVPRPSARDGARAGRLADRHDRPAGRRGRVQAHHDPTSGSGGWSGRVHLGARLAHQENKKGSLEPGKDADFAVYDVDPIDSPSLDGVRPVLTVSLGRDVYAA
jgi:predicted amidohydrolase YtcJ